jgi:hypothetical protein
MFQAVNINATMKYSSSPPDIYTYIYTHHSNAEFLSLNSWTWAYLGCTSRKNDRQLPAYTYVCVYVCLLKRNNCGFKLVIRYKVLCIVVPLHAFKAYRGSTVTFTLILNLSPRWARVVNLCPARITPCK